MIAIITAGAMILSMRMLVVEVVGAVEGMSSVSQAWPKLMVKALHQTLTQVTSSPSTPAGRENSTSWPE